MPIPENLKESVELPKPRAYKYALLAYKSTLTRRDGAEFVRNICRYVDITDITFYKWCRLTLSDEFNIPREKLEKIAEYMKTTPAALENFKIIPKNLK